MADLFSVDLEEGLVVVRYDGQPDEATFAAYLERYTALVSRGMPYAAIYVTMSGARMPPASYAKRQAAWMKEYAEVTGQYCRGLAFVLPSPLMRGVLRAILTMQPLGAPHVVLDDEQQALAWARARLG